MKKNNLLKAIIIMFLVAVVLSWVIPTGSYSSDAYTNNGTIPVGIINLFRLPVMTMQTFVQYTIVFIAIGIFYGVLNKTGVYDNIVKDIAKKFKGKEKVFLIIVAICYALLGTLTGLSTLIFLTIPFVAAILLVMGYDKISALLVTVGSMLVGEISSIFGFSGAGYVINVFSIRMVDEVITKIILFIILTGLYVFFIVRKAKLNKGKAKEENIPLFVKDSKNKNSKMPLVVISILFFIICFVGMYNWYYGWGIELFNNLDQKINGLTIGNYPLLSNILKGISILGYWGNYEFSVALIIVTFIIAWIYNIKLDDFIDGVKNGAKEMLPVALYATICSVVFTIMLANSGNMYATIVNWLAGIKATFNIPVTSLIAISGSLFYNDFYYLLSNAVSVLQGYEAIYYPITGVLLTGMYGIMMMVLPSSIMLVAGLRFFDVSYIDWLKKIWLYILEALVVLLLIVIIVTVLI